MPNTNKMVFFLTRHLQKRLPLHLSASQMMSSALQFRTGKYRVLQGNPYNENRIPLMKRFFLWELTYREFPVSLKGFGFAVHHDIHYSEGPPLLQFPLTFGNWVGRLVQSNFYEFCRMQLLPSHRIQELFVNYILVWKHSFII